MAYLKSARLIAVCFAGGLLIAGFAKCADAYEAKSAAFLADGENERAHTKIALIKDEILSVAGERYQIRFKEPVFCAYNRETVKKELYKLYKEEAIDLIIILGPIAGALIAAEEDIQKPVVLADIYDIDLSGLPFDGNASGRKNLFYLGVQDTIAETASIFRKLIPVSSMNVFTDEKYADILNKIERPDCDIGIEIDFIPYGPAVADSINALEENIDGVFFGHSDRFAGTYKQQLIEELNALKIPTFMRGHAADVELGILAGIVPKFYPKFARRIALGAYSIFEGRKPEEISVLFEEESRLVINARTARRLGISIPFSVVFEAKILFDDDHAEYTLTLPDAVNKALENNLLFRIRDEEIFQAEKAHSLQKSNYFPQLEYSLNYNVLDSGRARAAPAAYAKRDLRNRFGLNQLIFSDPASTAIATSRQQISAAQFSKKSQETEIIDEASRVYLDYLTVKALYEIARERLEATEKHLDSAKIRSKTGAGGREEVFRWQSEVAHRKSEVIAASADISKVRAALNQLMNYPQEKRFREQDVGIEMARYFIAGDAIQNFVEDSETLEIFIDFLVAQAMVHSPELNALEIAVKQQREIMEMSGRRYFLPEVGLSAGLENSIESKFYGQSRMDDNVDWFVGIALSYPIFEGGARRTNYQKQSSEWRRLSLKQDVSRQYAELEVRNAAYSIYSSYPNVELAKEAMANAEKNYSIVENKYVHGLATITNLLDAQTEKTSRQSQAVIAVYKFMQDLAGLNRAIGRFKFFDRNKNENWLREMQRFFVEKTASAKTRTAEF